MLECELSRAVTQPIDARSKESERGRYTTWASSGRAWRKVPWNVLHSILFINKAVIKPSCRISVIWTFLLTKNLSAQFPCVSVTHGDDRDIIQPLVSEFAPGASGAATDRA